VKPELNTGRSRKPMRGRKYLSQDLTLPHFHSHHFFEERRVLKHLRPLRCEIFSFAPGGFWFSGSIFSQSSSFVSSWGRTSKLESPFEASNSILDVVGIIGHFQKRCGVLPAPKP
jgi:hypothetical protein